MLKISRKKLRQDRKSTLPRHGVGATFWCPRGRRGLWPHRGRLLRLAQGSDTTMAHGARGARAAAAGAGAGGMAAEGKSGQEGWKNLGVGWLWEWIVCKCIKSCLIKQDLTQIKAGLKLT